MPKWHSNVEIGQVVFEKMNQINWEKLRHNMYGQDVRGKHLTWLWGSCLDLYNITLTYYAIKMTKMVVNRQTDTPTSSLKNCIELVVLFLSCKTNLFMIEVLQMHGFDNDGRDRDTIHDRFSSRVSCFLHMAFSK